MIQRFVLHLHYKYNPTIMEIQRLELTIDDIFSMNRHLITKLFIEDNKTEAEIVGMLHERRLFVSYETTIFITS